CGLDKSFVFEPASTIKAIIALHTMRAVMNGQRTMTTSIPVYSQLSGSCPVDGGLYNDVLRGVLYRMLKFSDNTCTQAFRRHFGQSSLDSTAYWVAGMAHSGIYHRIGCGDSALANPDKLTLEDAGALHEGIATATTLSAAWRDTLRTYMVNQNNTDGF